MAVNLLQRVAQFTLFKVSRNRINSLKLLSGRKVTATTGKKNKEKKTNTELLEQAFEQSQGNSIRRAEVHQQNQDLADASESNKGRFVPVVQKLQAKDARVEMWKSHLCYLP